jgi:chemotaxis protein histidine kinase CheA
MEGFEALLTMYRQALPEKREALEREWSAVQVAAVPEPHVQSLRRQLHNLAGSGGAYGFDAMGEMARQLEKPWTQWLATEPPRPSPQAVCAELAALWRTLLDALDAAALPVDIE